MDNNMNYQQFQQPIKKKRNPIAIVLIIVLACGNIALGIIPAGSGNGLATNLNIPKDINKAIEIIKTNSVHTIDVGRVEDNYFFSNLGFGIDAEVIKTYEENKKRTTRK